MKRPVTFYSEGCKLVGDVYYPDDLQPDETRAGIVLCHGYTGVKDLYLPDNARVLNAAGYREAVAVTRAGVCSVSTNQSATRSSPDPDAG